jgi:F0F1-type ATP synthase membrane subunit b/b'
MLLIQMVVIQVITFACLVFVLIRIMYSTSFSEIKRMKRLSEENAKKTEELNDKIAEAEKQYREKIDEAQKEANKIRSQSKEDAERLKEGALLNAKTEADRILKQALNSKEKIKEELESQLQQKSLDQSLKLIAHVLNSKQMTALHQVFVEEIIMDIQGIDVSRFKIDTNHASLIQAHEIASSQRERIISVLTTKTGKDIVLEAKVDENLIAGIVIKLGNLVIDASLRGRLNETCEALRQ